jgi:hypothetical protein
MVKVLIVAFFPLSQAALAVRIAAPAAVETRSSRRESVSSFMD